MMIIDSMVRVIEFDDLEGFEDNVVLNSFVICDVEIMLMHRCLPYDSTSNF